MPACDVTSRAGDRVLPVESFITGYRKTALAAGEVIAAIHIPFLAPGQKFAAYKLSKRFDQDISTVDRRLPPRARRRQSREHCGRPTAAWRRVRCGRSHLEAAVEAGHGSPPGSPMSTTLLARDFTPMGDHRGGAAYRLRAAAGLLRRLQLETSSNVLVRVEAL